MALVESDTGSYEVAGAGEPAILWHWHEGAGPTLGVAVHAGHEMRPELIPYLAIDELTRVREEDPYSDYWTLACSNRLLTRRSRFEIDLNRERSHAICVQPEDCWNLRIWNQPISESVQTRSLSEYDAFFRLLCERLKVIEKRYGRFVVYDLHTYNHRRQGPAEPPADAHENPEINVGTGSMARAYWAPVVDRFIDSLRRFDFCGRQLDVRENVKFRGRHVAEVVHRQFPRTGCVLAIEVKKFFMDEWTGSIDGPAIHTLLDAFRATVPEVVVGLAKVQGDVRSG